MRRSQHATSLSPLGSFDMSSVVSPAVQYLFHATGTQTCQFGNGAALTEQNTAPALTSSSLMDFDTDTRYDSAASAYFDRIFDVSQWTLTGGCVVAFEISIGATIASTSYIYTYGINSDEGGWNFSVATDKKLAIRARGVGASAVDTKAAWLDNALTSSTHYAIGLDFYLETATTMGGTVYINGTEGGTFTGLDLIGDGSAVCGNGGVQQLTIGANRSSAVSWGGYYGANADNVLGNFIALYQSTRDTTTAQDLSAFMHRNHGEPPRVLAGR